MSGPVKMDQIESTIAEKKTAKGSKDMRSFRPGSVKELNNARGYQPLAIYIKKRDGSLMEIPLGCGNSSEDLGIVVGALLSLWCFLLALYALLLKAAIDTDELSSALWIYFFLYLFFVSALGAAVYTGQRERERSEAQAAAEAAKGEESDDPAEEQKVPQVRSPRSHAAPRVPRPPPGRRRPRPRRRTDRATRQA